MKSINKFLVVMLCFVLFTSMAFALSACTEKELKITKIEVNGPSETTVGEFDYNDYTVKLIFDDGSTKDIKLNEDLLSASDRELLDTPGTHTITVKYNDVTCTFTVTIKGDGESQDKGIKSIAISGPNEIVAGNIDYNDFSLVITYEDDSTTTIELREEFILEEDRAKLNTVGSHSISITYNGTTTTWNITVKENESTGDNIFEGVTFEDATYTYDGREKSIEVKGVPDGATVKYNVSNSYTNAGIYPIEATISKEGYKTLVLTATLTINKATYDMSGVEFEGKTVVYNGEVQRIEISGSLPQGVTVTYENNDKTDVGTYEVIAKFTGDSNNYETIADMTATLTINKATYDMSGVEFVDKTVVYNGEVQKIEISGNLPQGVTVSYENNENINVGTYEVVAKFTGDSNNYEAIADMTATLTIIESDFEGVTFEDATYTYDGREKSIEVKGVPDGATVKYNVSNSYTNAGVYPIEATISKEGYKTLVLTATLTINKATYDMSGVEFDDKTVVYNGKVQRIEISGNLPQGVTVTYENNDKTDVGIYEVIAKFTGDSNNYEAIADMTATLTIDKATYDMSSVEFADKTVIYNGEVQRLAIRGTLPQGVTVSYENNGNINVGTYTVTAKFTGDSKNYKPIADMTATLTIKEAKETEGLIFEKINNDTEYSVVGYEGSESDVVILAMHEGLPVTSIGDYAFYNCKGLTSITIPDSVTSIGDDAFSGCSGLTSITIPSSVTSIGSDAFYGCTSLISITIPFVGENADGTGAAYLGYIFGASGYTDNSSYVPESLREVIITGGISIGDYAFHNCSGLTSITIPDSVTSIGDRAFYNCRGLESITIPDSVSNIGSYAFHNCSGLTSIAIPDSVTSIGGAAFLGCSGLTSITIPFVGEKADGTGKTNFGYIFGASNSSYNSTYVPESLKEIIITVGTSIGWSAFEGCSGLTSIAIPDSVTSIGDSAFEDCSGLTSITIPDSVTSIGNHAFSGCSELTSITIPDSVTSIGARVFYGCSGLTSITIPDSVTSIGINAFYGCTGLTSITIPDSVTSIGESAFSGCSGLTSITIPDSVTSIGENAFYGCSGLESITIPDSVTSIEMNAFYGCSGLASITIPNGVTIIGWSAFSGCSGLTSITIPDSVTSIGDHAFSGCSGLTSITIPDSVTSIGWGVFSGCSGLTSITIPDSVTSIGDSAFEDCSGLTSIAIPDSVTSIGNSAFSGCSGLTSITVAEGNSKYHSQDNCIIETASKTLIAGCKTSIIPDDGSVTSIGENAFWGCSGLTSITIPNRVTSIGVRVFDGCSGLTSITIPNSVTSIGWGAFYGCSGLTSITIGNGVTSIRELVFYGCSGLTSITIPNSVTSIGSRAFEGCSGLTSITIPDSVTSIGINAFYGCTGLTSIMIPDSVTSIGSSAFYECSGLKEVHIRDIAAWCGIEFSGSVSNPLYYAHNLYINGKLVAELEIPDSVTSIGSYAFYGCSGLTSITIPDSVTSIGSYAFSGCSGLTSIIIPDSVTSIGSYAFSGCSGLTIYCEVSSKPNAWNSNWNYSNCPVVWDCNNNEIADDGYIYAIIDGLKYGLKDGEAYIAEQSRAISGNVVIINNIIYKGQEYVVTSIGSYAFSGCSGLTSIMIPDSVTSIGNSAFSGCSGLTSITVAEGNSNYHSQDNCIIETAFKTLIAGCMTSVIPADGSVTSIGNYAFA